MKKIMIHRRVPGEKFILEIIYWANAKVGDEILWRIPNGKSAYSKATQTELQDIRDGKIVEKVEHYEVIPGRTPLQVRQDLEQRWNDWNQQVLNAGTQIAPGFYWDGTNWVKNVV